MPRRRPRVQPLRSATGVELTREVAFRFALDPTPKLEAELWRHAGAARYAWNTALAWVKYGLTTREWERELGAEPPRHGSNRQAGGDRQWSPLALARTPVRVELGAMKPERNQPKGWRRNGEQAAQATARAKGTRCSREIGYRPSFRPGRAKAARIWPAATGNRGGPRRPHRRPARRLQGVT